MADPQNHLLITVILREVSLETGKPKCCDAISCCPSLSSSPLPHVQNQQQPVGPHPPGPEGSVAELETETFCPIGPGTVIK
jgi:hypothetical protein